MTASIFNNFQSTANVGKVILSHPSGNEFVRAALNGMEKGGMLESFYTSVACFQGTSLDKLSRVSPFKDLKKRRFAEYLRNKTKTLPFRELGRIAASKAGISGLISHENGVFSVDAVYNAIDRHVSKVIKNANLSDLRAVYAFEDGAEFSFHAAKAKGLKCLYDLPIGYWRYARKLLAEERELRPDWAPTLTGFFDSDKKLARKDQELALADHIFVASSFTAESLKEYPGKLAPVSVIPYAFPPVNHGRIYRERQNSPLKLLFVGGLSQRKGIANVFESVRPLGRHVELTVVGHKAVHNCTSLNKALSEHKWIPSLPHAEILKLMQQNDLLIFPSLFEGFGLVITEAMSQGTPVITTERTAGPDLLKHGENGWLVKAGSTLALQENIEKILEDRSLIEKVGQGALKTAEQRPWVNYEDEFLQVLRSLIS